MKKFECNTCGIRICTAAYQGSRIPVNCTAGDTIAYWHEVKGEEQKLPKLTVEVFDRPDCPTWGNYAAVDKFGKGFYYRSEPEKTDHAWKLPSDHKMANIGKFDPSDWENSLIKRSLKEELPDWVKAGKWGYDTVREEYFKIVSVTPYNVDVAYLEDESTKVIGIPRFNAECVKAHKRKFNDKEMKALVGRTFTTVDGDVSIATDFDRYLESLCIYDEWFNNKKLADSVWQLDGKPCYKFEHLNEKGEWVE